MKKRKLLLSTLAAAVFVTGAGALVACGDGLDLPNSGDGKQPTNTDKVYTVTFDANGGTLQGINGNSLTTGKDGKLTGTMPTAEKEDHTFQGWALLANATVPVLTTTNFNTYVFDANTPVYAVYKENDGPGPVVGEEYDITFVAGLNGSLSGTTFVKTSNGIATFPEYAADEGYEFECWKDADNNIVYASTKFTKSTTVTAYFKEIDEPGPGPGPQPETLTIQVLVGGTNKVALDSYDAYLEDQTDGRLHDYGKADIELNANDVITFTVDGTAIDFWPDGYSTTIANLVTYNAGVKNTSVTVKADGTYAIYLKEYDTGWVLDVQGEADEPGPGPGPQPETLTIQVLVGGTNKVVLDSYDAYLGTQTDGRLHDFGKADIALSKDDVITFTVNGTAIDFWPDGYSSTIAGLVTYTADQKNTSVTVKADGTYAIYLKEYSSGWVLDVQGEADEPGPGPGPQPETLTIQVLVGGTNKVALDSYDAYLEEHDDGRLHDFGKADIALSKDDVITFTVNGTAIDFWPDGYSSTIAGLVTYTADQKNTSVTVKADGTYAIYLKEYSSGWVLDVQGEADEPGPGPDEPDDPDVLAVGQYIKVGDEFVKLTAGTPDSTKNEAEYYNVKIELTETTTIKLWTQSATGGKVRNMNALKINGADKFGWSDYGNDGTDHYDLEAGNYEIHYKVYKSGWVELDISKEIEMGDAIVISAEDADKCATITINGQSIKLYIKEGDKIVDLSNNSSFRIYAWSGINTDGYPGTLLTSEMNNLTGSFANVKFLINKGGDSTKTGDLSGINGPGVYVITYAVGGGSVAPGVVQA